jgi:hypothetical protein
MSRDQADGLIFMLLCVAIAITYVALALERMEKHLGVRDKKDLAATD